MQVELESYQLCTEVADDLHSRIELKQKHQTD